MASRRRQSDVRLTHETSFQYQPLRKARITPPHTSQWQAMLGRLASHLEPTTPVPGPSIPKPLSAQLPNRQEAAGCESNEYSRRCFPRVHRISVPYSACAAVKFDRHGYPPRSAKSRVGSCSASHRIKDH
ncbi:hypothetical protein G7K_1879-t1 [Saitoella complicata NRRL Y-17804]|uniref:Uncharacterized protein n=1 Tax=Saitoella complicata (strain BCRC 22490 / CBS 7301 / JCM 7358 / NBRC 10748 / NRRL Y-17804) TaxID=698492 RepID=A0A0E9NE41_SAICN|nr:hypothetical protein G7K_1879-t1 [Saitoella complicata NRRL Y-17804]